MEIFTDYLFSRMFPILTPLLVNEDSVAFIAPLGNIIGVSAGGLFIGVLFAINSQMSFFTPSFGFSLF